MSGIGVVLNPHSKKYKNNPERARNMSFIVGDRGSCRATSNLEELQKTAYEFKERGIEILAISGGDGTLHTALTHFIRAYGDQPLPKIALLRGGTLNTVAGSLKIYGSPEARLSDLLVKYHEGATFETRNLHLMKINDDYGFIWGFGVIYTFMENYYKKGALSPMGAAETLIRSIISAIGNGKFACDMFERFDAEVTLDGKPWPWKNYNAIYTGTVNQLGLNCKTFYLVDQQKHIFHANAFCMPPRNILAHVPRMFLGKPTTSENIIEQAGTEMIVKLKKPLPYTIDGDMLPPLDYFKITLGPELTILV